MSRSHEKFAPGEYYHLFNRGVEKRAIFSSKKDYRRFFSLLYLCNSSRPVDLKRQQGRPFAEVFNVERDQPLVDISAYALMPNHIHLLVRATEENGVSKFMQKLTTAYTMYFNTRHERSGALFQGKFKSKHAADDRYLKYLIAYIHLNPVALFEPEWKDGEGEIRLKNPTGAKAFLFSYPYSSFLDYADSNERPEGNILAKNSLLHTTTPQEFFDEVVEWLN